MSKKDLIIAILVEALNEEATEEMRDTFAEAAGALVTLEMIAGADINLMNLLKEAAVEAEKRKTDD